MTTDVLGYLQTKGLHLKSAGPTEVHTTCWFHGEDPGARGVLYINVDPLADVPGCYFCHNCEEKGNLVTLKRHFGDDPTTDDIDHHVRYEILQAAAAHFHGTLTDFEEVFQYLTGPERGLSVDTLISHKIGYAAEEAPLYKHLRDAGYKRADIIATGLVYEREGRIVEAFRDMITIPYLVAGNVVTIRGRAWPYDKDSKKPKYKTLPGHESRLFNTDYTWHEPEIVLCEGEFDAMVLEQLGYPAVAAPGAAAWQDSWDGYLAEAKRVYLVFDRDVAGTKGAAKLEERFGSKVRPIHLSPAGQKIDPTDWVSSGHTKADFQALLDTANRTGGILVTVREAVEEFTDIDTGPGLQFGVEMLDLSISPGLRPSQLMIVLAKTGTGKTLWLLNMMQRMARVPGQEKLKFLFLSLEQTRGEWFDRARRMHRFYNLDDTDEDAATFWQDRLLLADNNRISSAEVRQAIDDFEFRMGQKPDVICLDYLGYWARSFPGEEYAALSAAVMELKGLAKEIRIPIIAPHQVNRMSKDGEQFGSDAARGSGVIEETADFMFGIWSPDNQLMRDEEEKSGLVKMQILKSRHGGRGQVIQFQFAPLTLTMVPTTDPIYSLARDELLYASPSYRDTWEQAIWRHKTGFKGDVKARPDAPQAVML